LQRKRAENCAFLIDVDVFDALEAPPDFVARISVVFDHVFDHFLGYPFFGVAVLFAGGRAGNHEL
jgi:hypothetical protein